MVGEALYCSSVTLAGWISRFAVGENVPREALLFKWLSIFWDAAENVCLRYHVHS